MMSDCVLCAEFGEEVLFKTNHWRIIVVHDDVKAPAFCRVIWHNHVAEMTDLSPDERTEFMNAVYAVETAMREVLQPAKINLASLGNVVPHLHWHIIARFTEDACFPAPIWANAVRESALRLPEKWVQQVQQKLISYFQAA